MDWTKIEFGLRGGYFACKELFFRVDYETAFFDVLYPIDELEQLNREMDKHLSQSLAE